MIKIFICSIFIFFTSYSSGYSLTKDFHNSLAQCYELASKEYAVPEVILWIISYVESNNNPYAINVSGKGYYFKNRDEAEKFIKKNNHKSIDIGLMQINKWWFKKYKYDMELGLNPCWNIFMGAYILSYEYNRFNKDIWKAVAHYHSNKQVYQQRYIKKIYKELVKWQNAKR